MVAEICTEYVRCNLDDQMVHKDCTECAQCVMWAYHVVKT
jgi:hypothetical protein